MEHENSSPIRPKAPPLWRRPGRLWRYYRLRLMRIQASPHSIALGLSLGIFVGLLPIVPFHSVSALGLAWLFRASKVTALLGTLVSNPLDFVPHYLLIFYLGHKVLPLDVPHFDPARISPSEILSEGGDLLAVLMTGGLMLAVPAALLSYFITLAAVKKYRAVKVGT